MRLHRSLKNNVNNEKHMKVKLKNFANIENAEINLNGLTVLTGKTDTRKEYIAKALFSIIHGLYDFDDQVAEAITKKENT